MDSNSHLFANKQDFKGSESTKMPTKRKLLEARDSTNKSSRVRGSMGPHHSNKKDIDKYNDIHFS